MIGLVLKDTGSFFYSKIIPNHFNSALAEKIFKKFLKITPDWQFFVPTRKVGGIETWMNLENRIRSIPVYIRLDGATMILARRPVFLQ